MATQIAARPLLRTMDQLASTDSPFASPIGSLRLGGSLMFQFEVGSPSLSFAVAGRA